MACEIQLRPCPFCGAAGKVKSSAYHGGTDTWVECTSCFARTDLVEGAFVMAGEAAVGWNRRATTGPEEARRPTDAEIDEACMWYRHDYGMLEGEQREAVRAQAVEWLRAWIKVRDGDCPGWDSRRASESPEREGPDADERRKVWGLCRHFGGIIVGTAENNGFSRREIIVRRDTFEEMQRTLKRAAELLEEPTP